MNKPEYNRKMKALERDTERLEGEIETRNVKLREAWVERMATIMKGCTE